MSDDIVANVAARRIIMRLQDQTERLRHDLLMSRIENRDLVRECDELRQAYVQVCVDYEGLKRTHRLLTTREEWPDSGSDEEE